TKTAVVFALGYTTNVSMQAAVTRESKSYRDIVQEDYIDSYKNLTYKGIMWLKFASEYCPQAQYVLKVDDDIFVNIFNLVGHLGRMAKHKSHPPKSVICLVWYGMVVNRDVNNKWYVSKEEYANDTFPPYCSGSAYIITRDLIRPMYEQSFKIKFMWVDDWYITGALIEALHVEHTSIASLYVLAAAEIRERLVDGYALFGHVGSMNQRAALWKDVLKQKGMEVA
uniref:Hexosyltransferase n=2 Tax=Plectus sambesii TaxID=2011161 RepID=A0A914VJM7_9BILA